MNPLLLRQVAAVFRLEIKKSFFSRRGLWIYLLALIPVLIFGGHAWDSKTDRERLARRGDPALTLEKARSIQEGMTSQELDKFLPEPRARNNYIIRGEPREFRYYEGREIQFRVNLSNGVVDNVRIDTGCDFTEDTQIFAAVFQFFFVRLAIFFGCVFVFLNLFRGEMLDKSLHYYFLAPVRREVVVVGKFLAGLVATAVVFGGSTLLQLWIFYRHFTPAVLDDYLARGGGWQHAFTYIGIAALACLGYGSIFLAAGILIRNPLIPAAVMLFWESINGILPLMLRRFSVIYYLRSLIPVEIPLGDGVPPPVALLAMNVQPASAWLAILGLLALAGALVTLAARRARTLEIHYAEQ